MHFQCINFLNTVEYELRDVSAGNISIFFRICWFIESKSL